VRDGWIALAIGLAGAAVYVVSGLGLQTDYDYYGRLAQAFTDGRWWLDDAPSWLNELIPCGEGRFCVAYPPLPAILAVPLVPVFGTAVAQGLVAQLCGGASAGVLYLALRAFGTPRVVAISGAVLSALGTTLFFSSVDARAWYAAHSVAILFTALAFLFAARGERGWLVGCAIGLAALARLPVAAAFPALALLAARRGGRPYLPTLARVVLAGAPFAAVYVGYNVLRWGSPLDAGYGVLTVDDFFFRHGLFSPLYIPRHLYAIFIEAPEFVDGDWAFLRFRIIGMSLFLTTPAFLWVFGGLRRIRRDPLLGVLALCAGLALLPDILHGTVGFAQFGYRFSIDAQPFLIGLALAGDARTQGGWRGRPSFLFLTAALLSVAINIYGTVAISRFGYWQ
jgi:hypothetical protein